MKCRKRLILGEIIRAELMAQAAVESKLDLAVDLEVEAKLARRQLLASLAENFAVKNINPIQQSEAKNVVDSNRDLFSKHQLLTIEEIQFITSDETLFDKLDLAISREENLDRLESIAKAVQSTTNRSIKLVGTEQLPPAVLKPLLAAKSGVAILVKTSKDKGSILALKAKTLAPISNENAEKIVIGNVLAKQKRDSIAAFYRKQLEVSDVKYFAQYNVGENNLNSSILNLPRSYNTENTHNKIIKAVLAIIGTMIVSLLMLTYSYAKRWITGDLWIPRLQFWKPIPFVDVDPVSTEILPTAGGISMFSMLIGCSLFAIVPVYSFMWIIFPVWVFSLSAIVGVIFGVLAIQFSSKSIVRVSSRTIRWWPAVVFAILVWLISTAGLLIKWSL